MSSPWFPRPESRRGSPHTLSRSPHTPHWPEPAHVEAWLRGGVSREGCAGGAPTPTSPWAAPRGVPRRGAAGSLAPAPQGIVSWLLRKVHSLTPGWTHWPPLPGGSESLALRANAGPSPRP